MRIPLNANGNVPISRIRSISESLHDYEFMIMIMMMVMMVMIALCEAQVASAFALPASESCNQYSQIQAGDFIPFRFFNPARRFGFGFGFGFPFFSLS